MGHCLCWTLTLDISPLTFVLSSILFCLCFSQVTEVCGAKHLGYFGTTQFYLALKLLAAAQAGLPICLDSVTASKSAAQSEGVL